MFNCNPVRKVRPIVDRFMDFVSPEPNTGCWLWDGNATKGYGKFGIGVKNVQYAHRVSYQLFRGEIPKKLFVLHTCDVPLCVNPEHLFLGTHTDNMRDMFEKNRQPDKKGEKQGLSKLVAAQVIDIRTSPLSRRELAAKYNVSYETISGILHRRVWKHLP